MQFYSETDLQCNLFQKSFAAMTTLTLTAHEQESVSSKEWCNKKGVSMFLLAGVRGMQAGMPVMFIYTKQSLCCMVISSGS